MDKQIAIVTGEVKGIGKAITQRMVHDNYMTIIDDVGGNKCAICAVGFFWYKTQPLNKRLF